MERQSAPTNKAAASPTRSVAPQPAVSPLAASQQTFGNQSMLRLLRAGVIRPRLTVSQPNDPHELEAERVAEAVVRIPAPNTAQPRSEVTPSVQPGAQSMFRALGAGQPLPSSELAFFEPRFSRDFSAVRIHTDERAAQSAGAIAAQAYTAGRNIVFAAGRYMPGTPAGRRLMAHELAHVVHPTSPASVSRQTAPPLSANITLLRERLRDDDEDGAIEVMGRLTVDEARQVLGSREFKELAISAFNDDEMYRAMRAINGELYRRLEWMFDEGTNWTSVRDVVTRTPAGRDTVRTDDWMKRQFVDICDDAEMAAAVALLGGTLLEQLTWMLAEGSNWILLRGRITATTNPAQKLELYSHNNIRDFFVDVCNDAQMAEAVGLLGGTLLQQLTWMVAEGSSWRLVRARIVATTDPLQKVALYGNQSMRNFFVDVCDDAEMAEAVGLLGGTLLQQLRWMAAEGSNWALVRARLTAVADPVQNVGLYAEADMLTFFMDFCSNAEMAEAVDVIGGTLIQKLTWMLAEGANYAQVKVKILAAPGPDKVTALADQALLRSIQDELSWNNFARSVELLGRNAPSGATMIADAVVGAAVGAAWTASAPAITIWPEHDPAAPVGHPCNPPVGAAPAVGAGHEEGGFIYLNSITGDLATRSVAAGAQASLRLSGPSVVTDSIVVGGYHTHPNVGVCWGAPFASGADINWATNNGVPLLLRGAFPTVAATSDIFTGPTRLHLAGSRGLPGAAGGLAPQATKDRRHDEV